MDLERTCFLDIEVGIIYMMFIAWGGNNVYEHISSIVFPPALLLWQRR